MRLELTGRHVDITPNLRRLVTRKLSKLERLLNDRAVSAQAVLSREKHSVRADITLHARGERFLHGVGNSDAWEPSIGEAIEKIYQQAQRLKSKFTAAASKGRQSSANRAKQRPSSRWRPRVRPHASVRGCPRYSGRHGRRSSRCRSPRRRA